MTRPLHDRENPIRDPAIQHGAYRVLPVAQHPGSKHKPWTVSTGGENELRRVVAECSSLAEAEETAKRLHALDTPAESSVRLVAEPARGLAVVRGGR